MHKLFAIALCTLTLALQACKHPLVIQGEGDIIERLFGLRGCTLEEFRSSSPKCTDNGVEAVGYQVSYQAVAREGWEFVGWDGTACATVSEENYCEYDVAQAWVDLTNMTWPGIGVPATIAIFEPISTGGGNLTSNGRFDANGDEDWFKVQLQGGTTYKIAFEAESDDENISVFPFALSMQDQRFATLQSFSPFGFSFTEAGYAQMVFTPRLSSMYYVGAQLRSAREPTNYKASVVAIEDDFADNIDTTGRLSLEGSVSGNIDEPGDNDWFRIALAGGTTYQFLLTSVMEELPDLRAWSEDDTASGDPGRQLGQGQGRVEHASRGIARDEYSLVFTPERASTWYIAAVGQSGETGPYQISATAIPDDHPDTFAATASITPGGSLDVMIQASDDSDVISADLQPRTTYQFTIEGASQSESELGTLPPFFIGSSLEDDDGSNLFALQQDTTPDPVTRTEVSSSVFSFDLMTGPSQSPGTLTFSTFDGGIYFLRVDDPSGFGTFLPQTYTISLDMVDDDFPDTAATTGTIAAGTPASGEIESVDDQDWFRAELNGGTTYALSAQAPIDPTDPLAGLGSFFLLQGLSAEDLHPILGHDGVPLVGRSPVFGLDMLAFTPRQGGTYYFEIDNQGGIGSYTLRLDAADDDFADTVDTTGSIPVGGSTEGRYDIEGDKDWFRTQLQGGVTYQTVVAPQCGGLFGPAFLSVSVQSVEDGDGVGAIEAAERYEIGSSSAPRVANAEVVFTPFEGGTYYIEVVPEDYTVPCNYTLSLRVIEDDYPDNTATTGVLEIGN